MEGKTILGLTENVSIIAEDVREIRARVDTGATYSSIDKKLADELNLGPVQRTKVVRSANGKFERPFILVKVKMNGHEIEEEFTVADRSEMRYAVLIGQNILKKGNFLINPLKE